MRQKKSDGLMSRMAGSHPEQLQAWLVEAQTAWDNGKLGFVLKVGVLASLDGVVATEALDGILRIGWQFHSSALTYNSTGMNTEQTMFVFLRPTPEKP